MTKILIKARFVNPFILCAVKTMKSLLQVDAARADISMRPQPYAGYEVMIILGVAGDIEGQVIYGMRLGVALDLASRMMLGVPLDNLDEMAKSALCEMALITFDYTRKELVEAGYECQVTPPSVITSFLTKGLEMDISTVRIRTLIVPISYAGGEIEINIALREKKA